MLNASKSYKDSFDEKTYQVFILKIAKKLAKREHPKRIDDKLEFFKRRLSKWTYFMNGKVHYLCIDRWTEEDTQELRKNIIEVLNNEL